MNSTKHDVILVSADRQSFHLLKSELAAASPVFYDMFSMPQAGDDTQQVQTIQMDEQSADLEMFLILLFTHERPKTLGFEQIIRLFSVADKYQVVLLTILLCDILYMHHRAARPLDIWAYCTIYGANGLAAACLPLFDKVVTHNSLVTHNYEPSCAYISRAQNSKLSPSDLAPALIEQVPGQALISLLKCYDIVMKRGETWTTAAEKYGTTDA